MIENESFDIYLKDSASKTNAKAIIFAFLTYKSSPLLESEISYSWLVRFKEYLEDRQLSLNSRNSYLQTIISILSKGKYLGFKLDIDLTKAKKEFIFKNKASESVYLTRDELKLIEEYTPIGANETFARAAFLIGSYTGARISDIIMISEKNFKNGELNFKVEKTNIKLPLHPLIPELIKQTYGKKYSDKSAAAIVCNCMKDICHKIGIDNIITIYRRGNCIVIPKYKCISSQTARRSFATNLFLDGYELNQISKMMGQGNGMGDMKMISGYICKTNNDKIYGNSTYLCPQSDFNYELFTKMISIGLSEQQAFLSLVVKGIPESEINRIKEKYSKSVQIDNNYELFIKMISVGLSVQQAYISLVVTGVNEQEIKRIKEKYRKEK